MFYTHTSIKIINYDCFFPNHLDSPVRNRQKTTMADKIWKQRSSTKSSLTLYHMTYVDSMHAINRNQQGCQDSHQPMHRVMVKHVKHSSVQLVLFTFKYYAKTMFLNEQHTWRKSQFYYTRVFGTCYTKLATHHEKIAPTRFTC